ncbi:hypothetical protein NQ176_g9376 [Zarea fungicola]|uniref:Uncharacterized protein n=1 Tax=Zarea fungicola TaxID=93591 RepID=A0ACC1MP26_9HYPO|nr:hypothetical protein NQ176_g9376 [Lecanicillium fungicola]
MPSITRTVVMAVAASTFSSAMAVISTTLPVETVTCVETSTVTLPTSTTSICPPTSTSPGGGWPLVLGIPGSPGIRAWVPLDGTVLDHLDTRLTVLVPLVQVLREQAHPTRAILDLGTRAMVLLAQALREQTHPTRAVLALEALVLALPTQAVLDLETWALALPTLVVDQAPQAPRIVKEVQPQTRPAVILQPQYPWLPLIASLAL